jgi:butyrate kinase
VLTINPGSTSTKFALYDDEALALIQTIRHGKEDLAAYSSVLAQKDFRKKQITDYLTAAGVDMTGIDAVTGRGGLLRPIESGTYRINGAML